MRAVVVDDERLSEGALALNAGVPSLRCVLGGPAGDAFACGMYLSDEGAKPLDVLYDLTEPC